MGLFRRRPRSVVDPVAEMEKREDQRKEKLQAEIASKHAKIEERIRRLQAETRIIERKAHG